MRFVVFGGVGLVVLFALSFVSEWAENVIYKLRLLTLGSVTMVMSPDKRWKSLPDSDQIAGSPPLDTKRIVFIRHGESDWNEVFNRGFGPSFLPRLFKALIGELRMLVTKDSIFFDSALSELGMQQVEELTKFLADEDPPTEDAEARAVLRGDSGVEDSILVCSNLRRALATAAIGLRRRLESTGEKVVIGTFLQEVTFNFDGVALADYYQVPDLHAMEPKLWDGYSPAKLWDTSLNYGNKPVFGRGIDRMLAFNKWAFSRKEGTIVVAGGHSLYFRFYFKNFLGKAVEHIAKQKKLANAAAVSFELQMGKVHGDTLYRVDPASIKVVYGGFMQ